MTARDVRLLVKLLHTTVNCLIYVLGDTSNITRWRNGMDKAYTDRLFEHEREWKESD